MGETVDAVLALLVPGNEASAKRRREDKIPLDQTVIAFALASAIVVDIQYKNMTGRVLFM